MKYRIYGTVKTACRAFTTCCKSCPWIPTDCADITLIIHYTGTICDPYSWPQELTARRLCPHQMPQESTWQGVKQRLTPGVGARVMVNLGQSPVGVGTREMHPDAATTILALQAMYNVFGGGCCDVA